MLPSFEPEHMLNSLDESLAAAAWECLSIFDKTRLQANACGPRLRVCFSTSASAAFCHASPATAAGLAAHDAASWGLETYHER
jgi:hypothetical protein